MSRTVINKLSNSKFKDYVLKKVKKTIRNYKLFDRQDKIAVAISGGKDSTTLLYILKELNYNIEAVFVDVGNGEFAEKNRKIVQNQCKKQKVKLHILSFKEDLGFDLKEMLKIFFEKGIKHKSCMICGILRRTLLNKFAKENNFDYVATGHNLDDEAQAFLMNVFRSDINLAIRQGPKPGVVEDNKFVQRVKPLYFVPEKDILKYSKINKFEVNYCICPFSSNAYRREFIGILNEFEKNHPSVKHNIIAFQEKMVDMIDKKHLSQKELGYCEICGEPSQNEVCKTCKIIGQLKENTKTKQKEK